jgi:hypothetical protein
VTRRAGQPYKFRDAAAAYRDSPTTEYGLLMSTSSSRILFPKPTIRSERAEHPANRRAGGGRSARAGPVHRRVPARDLRLGCTHAAQFDISGSNDWRLIDPVFGVIPPADDLAKGGEWAIKRAFRAGSELTSIVDSVNAATPWNVGVDENDIRIDIGPFSPLFTIKTNYSAVSGALPKLQKPTLEFGPALDALKDILDALKHFTALGLDFDVDVDAGNGPSPSFIINITLRFRLGEGPNERIDIGVGKFYGQFEIHGRLEAALSGSTRGGLLLEFQGDIQQGVLPPLLYAGGLFRFALEIRETGEPVIELALGTTTSIGGDLIKNVVEVEVTIKYGYMLQPETLQPGVLLGLEARAKLMGGSFGFSFAVQAMARIERIRPRRQGQGHHLRLTFGSSQRCRSRGCSKRTVDFRTQFEQTLPLSLALVPLRRGAIAILAPVSPV